MGITIDVIGESILNFRIDGKRRDDRRSDGKQTHASQRGRCRPAVGRKEEALAYLDHARRSGATEDIQTWELLIRKFDKQIAQYGRTSN